MMPGIYGDHPPATRQTSPVTPTPDLSAVSGAITPQTADKAPRPPAAAASQVAQVTRVLEFACVELVPRLRATTGEIDAVFLAGTDDFPLVLSSR
jgi:hypothetical protein